MIVCGVATFLNPSGTAVYCNEPQGHYGPHIANTRYGLLAFYAAQDFDYTVTFDTKVSAHTERPQKMQLKHLKRKASN